jgi:flagellar basal body-associated protein FliL
LSLAGRGKFIIIIIIIIAIIIAIVIVVIVHGPKPHKYTFVNFEITEHQPVRSS